MHFLIAVKMLLKTSTFVLLKMEIVMNKEKATLVLCTAAHFLVDLTCIYFMTAVLFPMAHSSHQFLMWSVFYNFMAFALPALVGFLADRFLDSENALLLSAAGCFLVGAGYFFFRWSLVMILMIGLGNGMFHVGAGIKILGDSGNRYAPPGMFIASGAMGVFLGSTWGKRFIPLWYLFSALMLLCSVVLVFWCVRLKKRAYRKPSPYQTLSCPKLYVLVPCITGIFFVVLIRSYYGGLTNYSWKSGFTISLIFSLCIAGGKFCGGILADLIGIRRAVLLSLGLAGILAVFSFKSPAAGCLSIFFFNMTMPLTLSLLAGLMPDYQGFAFGFLMLALFLGTLPGMVFRIHIFFSPAGLLSMCLISMLVLLLVLRVERRQP